MIYLKNLLYSLHLKILSLKKICPTYSPDGPMLELEILGDRNNFIDLQRTRLEIVALNVHNTDKSLRTYATVAAQRDSQYLDIVL